MSEELPTHTPEPWHICYDGQINAKDGQFIAGFRWDSYKDFLDRGQDARRIIACVNACAGMQNPADEIATLRNDKCDLYQEMMRLTAESVKAVELDTAANDGYWTTSSIVEIVRSLIAQKEAAQKELAAEKAANEKLRAALDGLVQACRPYAQWHGPCADEESQDGGEYDEACSIDAFLNEQAQFAEQALAAGKDAAS